MGVMDVVPMNISFRERVFTLENIRGHYVMLFPVFNVFPKKKSFREDFMTIHIGWLTYLFHIRLNFPYTPINAKTPRTEHRD
jgi:hypothetical protein